MMLYFQSYGANPEKHITEETSTSPIGGGLCMAGWVVGGWLRSQALENINVRREERTYTINKTSGRCCFPAANTTFFPSFSLAFFPFLFFPCSHSPNPLLKSIAHYCRALPFISMTVTQYSISEAQ